MRALLVDCGVVVKDIPNQPTVPYFRLAFPKTITVSMVEASVEASNISEPQIIEFKYSFSEEEYDVYTNNTRLIPMLLFSTNHGGTAIKFPDDYKERIANVLYEFKPWLSTVLRGQEVSEGALDEVISVMSSRIKAEICL